MSANRSTEKPTSGTKSGWLFAVVAAGVAMANLDLFVVNVALPNIAEGLDESLSNVSWVLNGYTVTFAALLVPLGSLSDRIGPRTAYLIGVGLFTAASLACASAPNLWVLVAARVLQAGGSALLIPASLGLLMATVSPQKRPAAIGSWAALSALAAGVGPAIGGALTEIDWRWIFLINVPIGIATLICGAMMITYRGRGQVAGVVDILGATLLIISIGAFALALVKGSAWGWLSAATLGSLGAGVFALALCIAQATRHRSPALPLDLFRLSGMPNSLIANALFSIAFGAMLLVVPLWCQEEWHWTALQTGLAFAPGPLMVPLLTKPGRPLIDWLGPERSAILGSVLFGAGILWWMALVDQDPNYVVALLPGLLLTGVGVYFAMPSLIGHALRGMPPSQFSTGSGVVTMVRQVGMVIGVAGLVAILSNSHGASFTSAGVYMLMATAACLLACGLLVSRRVQAAVD